MHYIPYKSFDVKQSVLCEELIWNWSNLFTENLEFLESELPN